MIRTASRALAFFTLLGLPFLLGRPGWGQEGEPAPFEIRLPPEIRSEQVQATYSLRGPFGIRRDFLRAEPEVNVYQIGTSVNHQVSDSLKIILYAPGCQIVTISVRPLSGSENAADVTCEDLPPITFNGKVDLPEALRRRPYEVEIAYMAYWAHDFFGIQDGVVATFHLARVTPDESGAFHVSLPNFAKDAATESFRRDAGIRFIARERDTGNLVSLLAPANVPGNNLYALPIKPKYPSEVIFKPAPESPQNQTAGPTGKEAH